MPDAVPILLDTDPGSDIDDAVALAYLLAQPRCELLGVTTVSGDVAKRAELVSAICEAAGRPQVPIFAGATGPLLTGPGQPHVPHYEAIGPYKRRQDFRAGEAIGFLRDTIRSRPGEITLLGIGPLTNLALLFTLDPDLPRLLKRLVLMCGVFTPNNGHGPGGREWNAVVDPLATAIVYRQRPAEFTSIGLEVTTKCQLPADECRRRFTAAGGPLKVVADMAEVWFKHSKVITFHDPLAAATLFEPGLCRYDEGLVRVETVSERLGGLTEFDRGASEKPHRVAVDVDAPRFFEHYFGVVGG